jgi:hypothetical protein
VYLFFGVQAIILLLLLIIIVVLVKVNLSQHLTNLSSRHEDFWGSGDIAPSFLTATLVGGER